MILLILAFELEIFTLNGRWETYYLFFRRQWKWTVIDYSRYTTVLGVLCLLAQYITVPFLSAKLRLSDYNIAVLSTTKDQRNVKRIEVTAVPRL